MTADAVLLEDALNLFAGKLLGEGCSRKVFEHRQDPSLVIKVEEGPTHNNIGEWDAWMAWGFDKAGPVRCPEPPGQRPPPAPGDARVAGGAS